MDFNMKKLVKDAGTAISRVVQLTEEKLGTSEKTELDSHYENLAERADITKTWTERIVRSTEAVLTPNPGNRVEDYLFEKIDKKKPNRLSNLEWLGQDMISAGNVFGPSTSYGSSLIKVGQCEQRLGSIEREFITSADQCFVGPLQKFLEGEMKTINKERSILETKRLDLDACKNRVRKARNMLGTPANVSIEQKDGLTPEMVLDEAENDLRRAQSEFDRQAEITKLLLEGVSSSHAGHLRCLNEFVNVQTQYYADCHQRMLELQKELTNAGEYRPIPRVLSEEIDLSSHNIVEIPLSLCNSGPSSSHEQNKTSSDSFEMLNDRSPKLLKAKVLCDYTARTLSELDLTANEELFVEESSDLDPDYMMSEKANRKGKVPKVFLDIIES